jgi:hypothetical protein
MGITEILVNDNSDGIKGLDSLSSVDEKLIRAVQRVVASTSKVMRSDIGKDRKFTSGQIEELFNGELFVGEEAKSRGLIDKVMTISDLVDLVGTGEFDGLANEVSTEIVTRRVALSTEAEIETEIEDEMSEQKDEVLASSAESALGKLSDILSPWITKKSTREGAEIAELRSRSARHEVLAAVDGHLKSRGLDAGVLSKVDGLIEALSFMYAVQSSARMLNGTAIPGPELKSLSEITSESSGPGQLLETCLALFPPAASFDSVMTALQSLSVITSNRESTTTSAFDMLAGNANLVADVGNVPPGGGQNNTTVADRILANMGVEPRARSN